MRVRDAQDRLAVWTYQQAGEEIPIGDPSVTDAEREAAGRETLADRGRAALPALRMDRRPRLAVVGAATPRRAGLAALIVLSLRRRGSGLAGE